MELSESPDAPVNDTNTCSGGSSVTFDSSADARPWHPSATVRETGLSPSHPSPTPLRHLGKLSLPLRQFTLCYCAFHLGFGLGDFGVGEEGETVAQ